MMISGGDLMRLANFPSARLIAIFNIKLWKSGPLNAEFPQVSTQSQTFSFVLVWGLIFQFGSGN